MSKRPDYKAIRSGFGLVRSLGDEFIQTCERQGVPIEAIHRIVTSDGRTTMDAIAARVLADWEASQPAPVFPPDGPPYRTAPQTDNGKIVSASGQLPPDHYRVYVPYTGTPSMQQLKRVWGKNNVSVIFDGRPFTLHASCEGMDRTPGERTFYLHDAGGDWEAEERIAWGLKQQSVIAPNGYRPATEEETDVFAKVNPELVDFVGLGSFAMHVVNRSVARVWRYGGPRILDDDWFGSRWRRRGRVLFVCK